MDVSDQPVGDGNARRKWYRLGVLLAIANLVFIAILIVLLQYDLILALTVAVAVSLLAGIGITVYALRQR